MHRRDELLHELGRDHARPGRGIIRRVQLDDVGANDPGIELLDDSQDVADGEAARLGMGDSRYEGGVQDVEVERDVQRLLESKPRRARPAAHIADLHALNPTDAELEAAARWAMTHDVSESFRCVLKELLTEMNHESVAQII